MKYKSIIFDLDGTLLDTSEGIKDAINYLIKKSGYRTLTDDELNSFIGPPIQNSLINHFGCSIEEAQRGADVFREYYKNVSLLNATPYKSIYELLECIISGQMKVAVATYKREDYALRLLKEFRFSDYCIVMHGADNHNKLSKADIIRTCLLELKVKPEEVLYIGDTFSDYKAASECGMDFLGVTYGFGFEKNETYQFPTVDSCEEIMQFIQNSSTFSNVGDQL